MSLVLESRPLTLDTGPISEHRSTPPGGSIVRGCWCMFCRRSGKVSTNAVAAPENTRQLCELVDVGVVPGLLGYVGGAPAGWISLGPREDYAKLAPVSAPS